MAEPILADPLTARIVQQLSDAHLRTLKRKTDSIRDFRRRKPYGAPPQNSIPITRGVHGIPQVWDMMMEWKCDSDGSNMKLRARVCFGKDKVALKVFGQQCEVLADVPDTHLAGMRRKPMSSLVECALLEGYEIYRIVGRTGYLKVPEETTDLGELIDGVPANDDMTRSDFLRWLLGKGVTRVDRSAYKLLSRTKEYDALRRRLEAIEGDYASIGNTPRCVATDLMTVIAKDAALYFKIIGEGDERELTVDYSSPDLSYSGNVLTWCGSPRRDWHRIEGFTFSHIHRRPRYTQFRNRMRPINVEEALSRIDTDREILL